MRGAGGLARALSIAAIIILFITSPVVFSPAFQSQPIAQQISAFIGLFFNLYLFAASAVVLGWFVYRYFIWPRLRYNKLLRIRAAQGRGSRHVERI
jgi:lysylphosphatidylglycerol synthetase-like protein (DUF2156 family)